MAAAAPDVQSGVEHSLGDALADDVADQPVQRGEHPGVFARTGFGQVLVVKGQRPIEAVLGARFRLLADPVDHQFQRRGAVQPGGLGAPGLRRLGDGPVEQRQQQFVLAAEVLVEGAQRRLGARDHLLDGEVGAPGFAQYRHGRLDEAVAAGDLDVLVGLGHENEVTAQCGTADECRADCEARIAECIAYQLAARRPERWRRWLLTGFSAQSRLSVRRAATPI